MMLLTIELICDKGCVRELNEDIILLNGECYRDKSLRSKYEFNEQVRFAAVVADGMGGYSGGEIASEIVARQFNDFLYSLPSNLNEEQLTLQIKNWTQQTQQQLLNAANKNPNLKEMGSTLCGVLFYERMVFSLNIGDSRLYRYRDGVLKQLTTDHSMRKLTGDNSIANNIIYNSFGGKNDLFVDIKEISKQIFEKDIFLICSDGLSDMVPDNEIEEILSKEISPYPLVEQAKSAGGKDNISIITILITQTND